MMPRDFLHLKFPEERRSTCMSCPKSCYEGYRKDYRCCTYHPRIPNYLLGLSAQTDVGRERLEAIIERGMVTPEGMNSTPQQWVDYLEDLENDRFGKSEQVLCPMLEKKTGYCMVHAFRNSVCSTFFCLKDHGNKSENFWAQVQTLGSQVEMALAQWAMEQLDFSVDDYVQRMNKLAKNIKKTASEDGQGWSLESRKLLWGEWFGRELEFFEACGRLISENRDFLWEIANNVDIKEASKFDQAMVQSVPEELEDQVDPTDHEEDAETAPPQDLWDDALKAYHKIWKTPIGEYVLHHKISLSENPKDDDMSMKYQDMDYVVARHKGKKNKVDWRLFVTAEQYEALRRFKSAQGIVWELLSSPEFKRLKSPQEFIQEMIAKKILIKAK